MLQIMDTDALDILQENRIPFFIDNEDPRRSNICSFVIKKALEVGVERVVEPLYDSRSLVAIHEVDITLATISKPFLYAIRSIAYDNVFPF